MLDLGQDNASGVGGQMGHSLTGRPLTQSGLAFRHLVSMPRPEHGRCLSNVASRDSWPAVLAPPESQR